MKKRIYTAKDGTTIESYVQIEVYCESCGVIDQVRSSQGASSRANRIATDHVRTVHGAG